MEYYWKRETGVRWFPWLKVEGHKGKLKGWKVSVKGWKFEVAGAAPPSRSLERK